MNIRRPNRLARTAAAAISVALALVGTSVDAAEASSELRLPAAREGEQEQSSPVEVTVVPDEFGIVTPDEAVRVTVTITNTGTTTFAAGTLSLSYNSQVFASRTERDAWLSGDSDETTPIFLGQTITDEIRPGERATVRSIEIDPEILNLPAMLPSAGGYRMAANYSSGDDISLFERSSFVWQPVTPEGPDHDVAVAVPVTVPPTGDGLVEAEDLETYTAPGGVLNQQLEAVENSGVSVGVDPRIIASIRVLGSAAPDSAVDWLERLGALENTVFPLQYADADPALAVAAAAKAGRDVTRIPQLGSLDYALVPENLTDVDSALIPDAAPAGTAAESPSDAPSTPQSTQPPEPDDELPTTEQLIAWNWDVDSVIWPREAGVTTEMLPLFESTAGARGDTIIDSSQIESRQLDAGEVESGQLRSPETELHTASTVDGHRVLVRDTRLSTAFSDVASGADDFERGRGRTDLRQSFAMIRQAAATATSTPGPVLLTVDRSWASNASAFADAFESLESIPGVQVRGIDVLQESERSEVALRSEAPPEDLVDQGARVFAGEEQLERLASAFDDEDDASEFLGRERAEVLALLGHGWEGLPDQWSRALSEHEEQTNEALNAVQLVSVSQINVISGQASLPFTVRNELPYPIRITLTAVPDDPRLQVDPRVEATVAPGAHGNFPVELQAQLGNGEVNLNLNLTSPTGAQIGQPEQVLLNVRADWEGIGIFVLGALVVLLLGGGLIRTVLRRRRRSTEASPHEGSSTRE